MKIKLPIKQLVSALASLKSIAKPSTTHAILSNVALFADGNTLRLLASDLEKQLEITIPCEVLKAGSTTVPCARLHDSLAKIRAQECTISVTAKNEMTITAGNATTKIQGLPVDELPPRIEVKNGVEIQMMGQTLSAMMAKSLVHAFNDKTQPTLSTVSLVERGGVMNIQGTDRKRCVICETEAGIPKDSQFLIPRESVPAFISLCGEESVTLMLGENVLSMTSGIASFATKVIEGRVPDFDKIMPKVCGVGITANREELIALIEYAEIQTPEQTRTIYLSSSESKLSAKGQRLVSDKETDAFTDMNQDWIQCDSVVDFKVSVNSAYIKDALKCCEGQSVTIEAENATQPGPLLIKEGDFRIAIMPIVPPKQPAK